jgi:hypothetical protein
LAAVDVFSVAFVEAETLIRYVRSALDWFLKLLRTSQKWLQSFRRAGPRKNYGIYCIYNNDLEVHSYVENT